MDQNEIEQDDTSYCDRQRLDRILDRLVRDDRRAPAPRAVAMTTTWCEPAAPEGRPAPMDWEAILLRGTVHLFGYPSALALERH